MSDVPPFPEPYRGAPDYRPPSLRYPPALRCYLCFSEVRATAHVCFSCTSCGFLVCARKECAHDWTNDAELREYHAKTTCPKICFRDARHLLATVLDHSLRDVEASMAFSNALVLYEAHRIRHQESHSEEEEKSFLAKLRTPQAIQWLSDMRILAHRDGGKTETLTTVGELVHVYVGASKINDLGFDASTHMFVFLVIRSAPVPDSNPQLLGLIGAVDRLVVLKNHHRHDPEALAKLKAEEPAYYDAIAQPVTVLQFYADKEGDHVLTSTATPSIKDLFQMEWALSAVAPINVAYLITLVYAPDPLDEGAHRNATTKFLVRLMGTAQKPLMVVLHVHSTLYSALHWLTEELVSEDSMRFGLSTMASAPEDYDVVVPTQDHPRVAASRLPNPGQKGPKDVSVHVDEWKYSQRKNFLTKKNMFTGNVTDPNTIARFAEYLDTLTVPGDASEASVAKRHLLYTQLTGVKVPRDDAHAFKVAFTTIVARANLAI